MSTTEINKPGVRVTVNVDDPTVTVDVQVNVGGCCSCDEPTSAANRWEEYSESWLALEDRLAEETLGADAVDARVPPELQQGSSGLLDLPNRKIGDAVAIKSGDLWTEQWVLAPGVLDAFTLGNSFRMKWESESQTLPAGLEGDTTTFSYRYLPIPSATEMAAWPPPSKDTVSRRFRIEDGDGKEFGRVLREQDPKRIWFEHWVLSPDYKPPQSIGGKDHIVTVRHLGKTDMTAAEFVVDAIDGVANLDGWWYIGAAMQWKSL
jgi:hypothetical protein